MSIPTLAKARTVPLPKASERTLTSGLRVVVVRSPGVPLAEVRLRVPFAGRGDKHRAKAALLSATMLSGTDRRDAVRLAADLQSYGGSLGAAADADRLSIGGSCLADRLPDLLELLAEVLTSAAYPAHDVEGERERLLQDLLIARSQPAVLANEALARRLYGDHPYGRDLARDSDLAATSPSDVRSLHRKRVLPAGATLVVVGDVQVARTLDVVERALSGWTGTASTTGVPRVPAIEPGPVLLVNRAGAVQTNIRLAGAAVPRNHPDHAALHLANLVFAGYFSSRLVANIREDKGYTYSPRSHVDHAAGVSQLVIEADVATGVTAPALLEIGYELGRVATSPVTQEELDAARAYGIGALALSTATQAGLATTLSHLLAAGVGIEFLRDFPKALGAITVERAFEAAQRYLSPASLVSVLLGDAAVVGGSVAALGPVTTVESAELLGEL